MLLLSMIFYRMDLEVTVEDPTRPLVYHNPSYSRGHDPKLKLVSVRGWLKPRFHGDWLSDLAGLEVDGHLVAKLIAFSDPKLYTAVTVSRQLDGTIIGHMTQINSGAWMKTFGTTFTIRRDVVKVFLNYNHLLTISRVLPNGKIVGEFVNDGPSGPWEFGNFWSGKEGLTLNKEGETTSEPYDALPGTIKTTMVTFPDGQRYGSRLVTQEDTVSPAANGLTQLVSESFFELTKDGHEKTLGQGVVVKTAPNRSLLILKTRGNSSMYAVYRRGRMTWIDKSHEFYPEPRRRFSPIAIDAYGGVLGTSDTHSKSDSEYSYWRHGKFAPIRSKRIPAMYEFHHVQGHLLVFRHVYEQSRVLTIFPEKTVPIPEI